MKKRSRAIRRNEKKRTLGDGLKQAFSGAAKRRPKTYSFERLEERYLFSATPLNYQVQTLSSNTIEGEIAQLQRELAWWEAYTASSSAGAAAQTTVAGASAQELFLRSLPTDPLLLADPANPKRASQWHLINTGQQVGNPDSQVIYGVAGEDINVVPVWQGQGLLQSYTGQGVTVAVIDSGVQLEHPDLAANLDLTLAFDAIQGDSNPSPTLFDPSNAHGTAVAGLIAADNNNQGGVGVAYNAKLAPIRLIDFGLTQDSIVDAFRFAIDRIDITNNSWGPNDIPGGRGTSGSFIDITPEILLALRDSIEFGRGGLGVIHVFASGNSAGPGFSPPFGSIGTLDSANFDSYVNSRYTIGVTGVDHDGLYANVDGTFTAYPEIGTSVLVAAPTGSNAFLDIADDTGLGSGIVTTDFTGNFGYNQLPLAGVELDRDFLADTNYTSRFNGTSAAAPIVSGVIALMLEANPNLSWRDVQEILVRSARQNAQFEIPSSGAGGGGESTWRTNQLSFFQDPDIYTSLLPPMDGISRFREVYRPVADPALHHTALWTNAAGYTVSMGFGVYGESTGYGHGVVDAELAVKMAENWHKLNQNLADELTFSTFVVNLLAEIQPAEKGNDDSGLILVPGGFSTESGFIDFWNEYFVEDDPESEDDGPFSGDDPPVNERGQTFLEFNVPDNNAMTIENVELKLGISGPSEDLDELKIMLVSPEGTFSEFNPFAADAGFLPFGLQQFNNINLTGDLGNIDPLGDTFTWTFSTNRSWGERSSDGIIMDPATGEPALFEEVDTDLAGTIQIPTVGLGEAYGSKGWRIYFENWSDSEFVLDAIELAFHGNPIQAGTQRVQGFVGIDEDDLGDFNFSRFNQVILDLDDGDVLHNRIGEVQHILDTTQEQFASNILVSAYKVVDGVTQSDPDAQFITGDDGNYYFDLVPGEYIIRATDLDDPLALATSKFKTETPAAGLMAKYKAEWRITEDWFVAPQRNADLEVEADAQGNPIAFKDSEDTTFEYGPRYINFLVDLGDVPPNSVEVSGSVIVDLNGDGILNGDDAPAAGFSVYFDANQNNTRDAGEDLHPINLDGTYTITVLLESNNNSQPIAIGIEPPNSSWIATNPATGIQTLLVGPGDEVVDVNFFFKPPTDVFDPEGNAPGDILGVVYNDRNGDHVRQPGEAGVAGFTVFVDTNENGLLDNGEISAVSASNGAYYLANVPRGTVRLDIVVPASWSLSAPVAGFQEVVLVSGGILTNIRFGVINLATGDWGDLPDSYKTTSAQNGPRHTITPGFSLGALNDGEVNGAPTADASGDDAIGGDEDGIVLLGAVSNPAGALVKGTTNAVRATLNGVGGILNGWFDFNRDGDFDDDGEHAIDNEDLNPGIRDVAFPVPDSMVGGPIAARFRWGHAGISYFGLDGIGEVEDYYLANSVQQAVITSLPGDYNDDNTVNDADYAVWRANFGSTTNLAADGNGNGTVDSSDYSVWRDHYGQSIPAGGGGGSAATNSGGGSSSAVVPTAPVYTAVTPQMAAHLESLGYVPMTIRSGMDVRTVYMLPGTTAGGSGGSGAVASRGPAAAVVTPEVEASGSAAVTLAVDSDAGNTNRSSSRERHSRSGERAARVDSALLILAATAGRLDREHDGEACDLASAWNQDDDESNSAVDLALATFESKPKWRRVV